MSEFVSGQELSRQLYESHVRPALVANFPGLRHSAALLGRGSEVLGHDDEMSTDHDAQTRVIVFVSPADEAAVGTQVREVLAEQLPDEFAGRPTSCELVTVRGYVLRELGVDLARELEVRDWLTLPEQQLCTVTAGQVFHDEVGLQDARDRLAYYPRDVWLYLMVATWGRLSPEANLVGRVGDVGDDLGSALMASRLVHELMRLCFLMERTYAPYPKWFGTAFARLSCAEMATPLLQAVLTARTWRERQDALIAAYAAVADLHNALALTPPVETTIVQLWDRPYQVLWGDFPDALAEQITDPVARRLVERWPMGGIDELRDVLWHPRDHEVLVRAVSD
jgi:hypothetical protein